MSLYQTDKKRAATQTIAWPTSYRYIFNYLIATSTLFFLIAISIVIKYPNFQGAYISSFLALGYAASLLAMKIKGSKIALGYLFVLLLIYTLVFMLIPNGVTESFHSHVFSVAKSGSAPLISNSFELALDLLEDSNSAGTTYSMYYQFIKDYQVSVFRSIVIWVQLLLIATFYCLAWRRIPHTTQA